MIKLQTQFKIRIVYKSGTTQDFWCSAFTAKASGYTWVHASNKQKPLLIGADEIVAVWQVGTRYRFAR